MVKGDQYVIFFDDGGVLNNNEDRRDQWSELITKWFVSRYSGEPEVWEEAAKKAYDETTKTLLNALDSGKMIDIEQFHADQDLLWLQTLLEQANQSHVPTKKNQLTIVKLAKQETLPQINTAYDGIIDAVKSIADKHGPLYTASNDRSFHLDLYLKGMELRQHFSTLYGSDLLGCFKSHKEFYIRLLENIELTNDPSKVIFIEDHPQSIDIIDQIGAIPVQARFDDVYAPVTDYVVDQPDQLPSIIDEITG